MLYKFVHTILAISLFIFIQPSDSNNPGLTIKSLKINYGPDSGLNESCSEGFKSTAEVEVAISNIDALSGLYLHFGCIRDGDTVRVNFENKFQNRQTTLVEDYHAGNNKFSIKGDKVTASLCFQECKEFAFFHAQAFDTLGNYAPRKKYEFE